MTSLKTFRYNRQVGFNGEGFDSAEVIEILGENGSMVVYNTLDSLPASDLSAGDQAFVLANKRHYISNGNGWYNFSLVNLSPSLSLDQSGTIALNAESLVATITASTVDSDDNPNILSYSVESDGNMYPTGASVSQDSSVFTVTSLSEDSGGVSGNFTLTFKVTDQINTDTEALAFSVTFSTIVDSSATTVLLVKADGNGLENDAITFLNSSEVSTGFTETNKPQASTFTPYRSGGYSIYFDQSGDYLNPYTALDTFTGRYDNWTIEFWIYRTGNWGSGYPTPIGLSRMPDGYNVCLWGNNNNASYDSMWLQNTVYNCSDIIPDREWTFVSLTYDGVRQHVHYNGVRVLYQEWYFSSSYPLSTMTFGIGAEFDNPWNTTAGNYFGGYMTDIRLSNTARYTGSTSTVPTEPLTDDANTVFLLSQNNPYLKDVSGGFELNHSGPPKMVPFSPFDYSPWTDSDGGSVYFDGTNYIQADLGSGAGPDTDYTIEFWTYFTNSNTNSGFFNLSATSGGFIANSTAGIAVGKEGNDWIQYVGGGTSGYRITDIDVVADYDRAWNHVAVVRSSGTNKFYLNGKASTITNAEADSLTSYRYLAIGGYYSTSYLTPCYIADFRYVKGTAVYTSDFTPPTAPLPFISGTQILMNNKSDANIYDAAAGNVLVSVDDSLYNLGVRSNTASRQFSTSSSMYWSGDGNYLQLVSDTEDLLAFGTGDFTVEFWMRADATASGSNSPILIDFRNSSGSVAPLLYISVGTTDLIWWVNGAARITGTSSFSIGTWHHIAVSRNSGSTKMFVDGSQVGSTYSDTQNYVVHTNRPVIGTNGGNVSIGHFQGRMQDIRITKGKGRYTANFTPPATEFSL